MTKSDNPTQAFPERLRAVREKRNLSQVDLADRAGFSASAISHFETGTRKPSFDNLRRLADTLYVTTDYLLGRATEEQAFAGADNLYRDIDRLNADDRKLAEDIVKMLVNKRKGSDKDKVR